VAMEMFQSATRMKTLMTEGRRKTAQLILPAGDVPFAGGVVFSGALGGTTGFSEDWSARHASVVTRVQGPVVFEVTLS
jgi:hypothetical protein